MVAPFSTRPIYGLATLLILSLGQRVTLISCWSLSRLVNLYPCLTAPDCTDRYLHIVVLVVDVKNLT